MSGAIVLAGGLAFSPPGVRAAEPTTTFRRLTQASLAHQEALEAPLPDESFGLEELEQLALRSNPAIALAQANLEAARGAWVQAGLPPNPSFGYSGQQLGSEGLAEQEGVFIGQEIVRGGKLRLNREVAAREISRQQQLLAAARQRVLTDVRLNFYQVLVAERQLQLSQELLQVSERAHEGATALFQAKEVSRAEVLQAELEVENSHILVQNARNRNVAAWNSLAAVCGQRALAPQPLRGELIHTPSEYDWDATLRRLLTTSPQISAAVANIEHARAAFARAQVEPRPNLDVQGVVNWRDNGVGGRSDGILQVTAPIPVWNRNQGRIAEAIAEVRAAERALEQLEFSLQQQLAPVFEQYQNARSQVLRYQTKILPAAQETLEITRQSFEAGETGYLNQLTAQRTYSQIQLNYLDALRKLREAEIEMEGLLLMNSLNPN